MNCLIINTFLLRIILAWFLSIKTYRYIKIIKEHSLEINATYNVRSGLLKCLIISMVKNELMFSDEVEFGGPCPLATAFVISQGGLCEVTG